MRSRALVVVLLIAGCGAAPASPSSTPSVAPSALATIPATTTLVETTSTTYAPSTTTTTVPFRELMITGTGQVYTLEESQAFGEFGPLLWNLVTTLNGTSRIEHGPGHEWVTWGPMWGGRIDDGVVWRDTYGVTDLDAVDPVAVAAAVPAGQAIVLREVRWSLDELNDYSDRLRDIASTLDTNRCGIGWGTRPGEGLHIQANSDHAAQITAAWKTEGLPMEVLQFEFIPCLRFWEAPVLVKPEREPSEFIPE